MNVAWSAPQGAHYHAGCGCLNLGLGLRVTDIMNSWGAVQYQLRNWQH